MSISHPPHPPPAPEVAKIVRRVWGFDVLRPLQAEAIAAALNRRDSLVVMPTGGGKSLCYQVPPLVEDTTTIVVSPLLSLIKDQIDGLRESGVPAAGLHGAMSYDAQRDVERGLLSGRFRLVFTTPERLLSRNTLGLLQQAGIHTVAIDEAHCISHWGHDFRPEYRRLREARDALPDAAFHAYTATATERVRRDIVAELGLRDPTVLIGTFDRPNLIFRVIPRSDEYAQVIAILQRHRGEAVIIYCIARKDTESLAASLKSDGYNAAPYHAGLDPEIRRQTQEAFSNESLDIVVATVAFGMGIDRSNVRCVLHAAMPKSIEHYQQEAGRAGRDGLPAECALLYSPADAMKWESLLSRADGDASDNAAPQFNQAASELLTHMRQFCSTPECRHRRLSAYFGQALEGESCGACDVCLQEVELGPDERVLAQKIISCVARAGERFGVGHVVDVLTGANTERIRQFRHDSLSTYGLLRDIAKEQVAALTYQLLDQGLLSREEIEIRDRRVPIIKLNEASWQVLRNQRPVYFRKLKETAAQTAAQAHSWEGVDRELFDALRELRRSIAAERNVAPVVLLHDAALRSLARVRPASLESLVGVRGLGEHKVADMGERVLQLIRQHVRERGLSSDQPDLPDPPLESSPKKASGSEIRAAELFRQGASIAQVCAEMNRAQSTVHGYLEQYILRHGPAKIDTWIDDAAYAVIAAAADQQGIPGLRPIYEALNGTYGYEQIRIVVAHRRTAADRKAGGGDLNRNPGH